MRLIGITGGIGAGKSVVSRILRLQGHEVYDCDSEAKRLMDASGELKSAIACRFGSECVGADGSLDRKAIAGYVFGNDTHREWLNGLVHGLVREDIARRLAGPDAGICFVESAIMHTSHLDEMCDEVWLVDAPEEMRLDRASRRDGADRQAVMARMRSQRDEFANIRCGRVVRIDNDGTVSLLAQIERLTNSNK